MGGLGSRNLQEAKLRVAGAVDHPCSIAEATIAAPRPHRPKVPRCRSRGLASRSSQSSRWARAATRGRLGESAEPRAGSRDRQRHGTRHADSWQPNDDPIRSAAFSGRKSRRRRGPLTSSRRLHLETTRVSRVHRPPIQPSKSTPASAQTWRMRSRPGSRSKASGSPSSCSHLGCTRVPPHRMNARDVSFCRDAQISPWGLLRWPYSACAHAAV